MPANPLEVLRRAFLTGPMLTRASSGPNQFAGRTTLNSGSATVTVSSTVVKSDSIIMLAVEANTRQDSGVAAPIEVMSVFEGGHFTLGTAGTETLARDTTIMWEIKNQS